MAAAKDMSLDQLNARLEEIAVEREEINGTDFEAMLRQTVISGGDGDAVEEREAKAARRLKHLRIEAEALEEYLPAARLCAAQPALDAIRKQEQQAVTKACKAAERAMKAAEAMAEAMADYKAANDVVQEQVWPQVAEVKNNHDLEEVPRINFGIHHGGLNQKMQMVANNARGWAELAEYRTNQIGHGGVPSLDVSHRSQ